MARPIMPAPVAPSSPTKEENTGGRLQVKSALDLACVPSDRENVVKPKSNHRREKRSRGVPEDDPYDPRKPEYIIPATADEVLQKTTQMHRDQIARLEAAISKRKSEDRSQQVLQHYQLVLEEDLKCNEGEKKHGKSQLVKVEVPRPTSLTAAMCQTVKRIVSRTARPRYR